MLSGLNSPDREDYVFAEWGNYALKKIKYGKYKKNGKQ